MKNVKMILPIVAFVFAVVGAFASINTEVLPPYYIVLDGQCVERDVPCIEENAEFLCRVIVNGTPQQVYDTKLFPEPNVTICQDAVQHISPEPIQTP